jgi:hypothetical protein
MYKYFCSECKAGRMDGLKRLQETRKEKKALLEEVKKIAWIMIWKWR